MRFRIDQILPGTVDAVERALFDPAFLSRLGTLPNLGAPRLLEQDLDGDRWRQRVRYAFVGSLSPAATRFIEPARLTWVEETVLDRTHHRASHVIHPDHYANRLSCSYTTTLKPAAGGVLRAAEGELRVRVPVVGRNAERAIVTGLEHHARREAMALQEWLDARA